MPITVTFDIRADGAWTIRIDPVGPADSPAFSGKGDAVSGLFDPPARLELRLDEVALLRAAAKDDWSQVRPEIFGTLFEHSLGAGERVAAGRRAKGCGFSSK